MTRPDQDPQSARVADGLRLLEEALRGRSAPEVRADDATATWQRATRDAARKLCAQNGHKLQIVVSQGEPTAVKCGTCETRWPVAR